MQFTVKPYLPEKKVTVAVGNIKREDITMIPPFDKLNLPEPLKKHADLSFCYIGGGKAVCAKGSGEYYQSKLKGLSVIEGATEVDKHYPFDAAYNIAIVGEKVFCKTDSADRVLLDECEKMGYKIIHINQGYSKCSVCPIGEFSAISGDKSFFKAAEREGIDTLLIKNDSIILPGYNTGFFGGSAYMESKNVLKINGDINLHPDRNRIYEFLKEKNIEISIVKNMPIEDFGSFIPVWEE